MPRVLLYAVIAIAFAVMFVIQLSSEAFYARPGSFSSALSHALGVRMYGGIERIVPLWFVEEGLAEDALARRDLDAAQAHALRLPDGARRDDMLGQILQARGDLWNASELYEKALDPDRLQPIVEAEFKTEPGPALNLESDFCTVLRTAGTHPDALGECLFTLGTFYNREKHADVALAYYEKAIALAPLNGRYIVTAGGEALRLGEYDQAKHFFQSGVDANPANGDALAGLGIVAFHQGNRALAQSYETRARAADHKSVALKTLDRLLK